MKSLQAKSAIVKKNLLILSDWFTESFLTISEQAELRTTIGRPLQFVDLRVVDENMSNVPANGKTAGEIVVRSPWVTQGYFKDAKSSENLWKDSYLHTGDVAVILPNGFFKITDRAKDVIKIAGEWVSSLELENILIEHDAVSEVAVVSTPDTKWGEKPLALIVKEDNSNINEKELVEHIKSFMKKGVLGRSVVLMQVKFIDEIFKTSVGKVDKKLLRERYA